MTREEAVARIKDHIEIHRYHERNAVKIFEALDMAIKALEQQSCDGCKFLDEKYVLWRPCFHCMRQNEDYYEPYSEII